MMTRNVASHVLHVHILSLLTGNVELMHFGSEQGSAYLPRNRVCVWETVSSLDPLRAASHVLYVHLLSMLTRHVASHVLHVHLLYMLTRHIALHVFYVHL